MHGKRQKKWMERAMAENLMPGQPAAVSPSDAPVVNQTAPEPSNNVRTDSGVPPVHPTPTDTSHNPPSAVPHVVRGPTLESGPTTEQPSPAPTTSESPAVSEPPAASPNSAPHVETHPPAQVMGNASSVPERVTKAAMVQVFEALAAQNKPIRGDEDDDDLTLKILVDGTSENIVRRVYKEFIGEDDFARFPSFCQAFDQLLIQFGAQPHQDEVDEQEAEQGGEDDDKEARIQKLEEMIEQLQNDGSEDDYDPQYEEDSSLLVDTNIDILTAALKENLVLADHFATQNPKLFKKRKRVKYKHQVVATEDVPATSHHQGVLLTQGYRHIRSAPHSSGQSFAFYHADKMGATHVKAIGEHLNSQGYSKSPMSDEKFHKWNNTQTGDSVSLHGGDEHGHLLIHDKRLTHATFIETAAGKMKLGSPAHMEKVVRKFNHHSEREHHFHMEGTTTRASKAQKRHDKEMTKLNKHFVKHFGHMIPKKDRTGFHLGHYETSDPKKFASDWFSAHHKGGK